MSVSRVCPTRTNAYSKTAETVYRTMGVLSLLMLMLSIQACSWFPFEASNETRVQEPINNQKKTETPTPAKGGIKHSPPPPASTTATEPRLKAGECWAPTVINPRKVSTELEIVTRDAVNKIQVRPATTQPKKQPRVERTATQTYRVEPPTFRKVTEKILVKEAVRRTVVVPATFETRTEKIKIEAAHNELVPCRTPGQSSKNALSNQAVCVKEKPARYKTLTRKILLKPETTREVVEPAVYRTYTTWIVEKPARTIPIDIPEKNSLITVQTVAKKEVIVETQQPPKVATLNSVHYEGHHIPTWRQIPCEEDLSPQLIKQLQSALKHAGFKISKVDGALDDSTLRAVQSYQDKHGLASGALTLETMHHLGIFKRAKTKAR